MKVLYATLHNPCADAYGAQIRSRQVLEALLSHAETHVLFFDTHTTGWPGNTEKELDRLRAEFGTFSRVDLPNPFVGDPKASDQTRARLSDLARGFDAIWIHGFATARTLRWAPPIPSVLDIDDLQSSFLWSFAKGWHAAALAQRVRSRLSLWEERIVAGAHSACVVCSGEDGQTLGEPAIVLPNIFVPKKPIPERTSHEHARLGFIGRLGYYPNAEALRWFAKHVWPGVQSAVPGARIRVIGALGEHVGALPDGFDELGPVEDAGPEIATWAGMIVPLWTGAGTRIKVAEAVARNCPVVSTSLGAFGYGLASGKEILLADGAPEFRDGCLRVLLDRPFGDQLAGAAARALESTHSMKSISAAASMALNTAARVGPPKRSSFEKVSLGTLRRMHHGISHFMHRNA